MWDRSDEKEKNNEEKGLIFQGIWSKREREIWLKRVEMPNKLFTCEIQTRETRANKTGEGFCHISYCLVGQLFGPKIN